MRMFAYASVVLATFSSGLPVSAGAPTDSAAEAAAAAEGGDRITILPKSTNIPAAAAVPTAAATEEQSAATMPVEPPVPKPAIRPLPPTLKVAIDLSKQRMTVSENGKVIHSWAISSGRAGYRTPTGTYRPQWLTRMHYSKKYDNAPMPYSVFFHHGYAIHATYATRALGRPASHGCIRLAPSHAKTFYNLVQEHGKGRTRIALSGVTPAAIAEEHGRTRRASAGSDRTSPKMRRRPPAHERRYYAQPRRYVWPGDKPTYYRPRYGTATYRHGY